jgi:predicted transcriptional regulator
MLIHDEKLTSLADQEMVKIMNSIIFHSKSITAIIREAGIAHTTAYRKIKWMVEKGLLVVEKIDITEDGKKFSLLKSVFKSISVRYEHDEVTVEVEQNVNALHNMAAKFFSLNS